MYSRITTSAKYSPWLEPRFMDLYEKVRPYTLVDMQRGYELWDLVRQVKAREGALIELGVWNGGTAALIASQSENNTLYLCDTFTGVVKATAKDSQYRGGEHADCSIENVKKVVELVRPSDVRILKGIFPEETGKSIPGDILFKFMHLDVDVYKSTKDAIEWIWPRMIRGGIIVVDDYGAEQCDGVTKAINELNIIDMIKTYNLNGHAVLFKI